MHRKRYWGLVEVDAMMTRWVVVARLIAMHWDVELQVRTADRRRRYRCRRVRYRRLRPRYGARPEVIPKGGPLLAKATGTHTRNHGQDIRNI